MKQQAGSAQQRYEGAKKQSRQQDGGKQTSETAKTADILIALSARGEELFHAPDGTGYAIVPITGHVETWPVRSRGFRRWLAREYYNESKSAPNSDALQAALNVIEAKAHFDGRERVVYIRVGSHADRLYLDLGDAGWRAVEIAADGWRIVDRAPIPFRRPAGMLALPDPVRGGKIDELRPFLNIENEDRNSFALTVSFVLAALRPSGPYPVWCLSGEHGAAKSTFAAVLRKLTDPNSAPLRALPREDRDLFIAANNAHLLAFDNISKLPDWISDTLCRLSTGGGFATRQLYSDQDEALFDAMRPIVLNGIEYVVVRPDLADRALFMALKNIADNKRKAELKFWREFDAAHPRILGAFLDGVAHGVRELPNVQLEAAPRMADFALWATACEGTFWPAGTFAAAYQQNRDDALGAVIEADLVATAVQNFMAARPDLKQQLPLDDPARTKWSGTATSLLANLKLAITEEATKHRDWPKTPRALSGRLRRAAATLRRTGIEVTFDRDTGGKKRARTITLSNAALGKFASGSSDRPDDRETNGLAPDGSSELPSDNRPAAPISDGRPPPSDGRQNQPSDDNPLKNNAADDTDDPDASSPRAALN
jgi:hypothetical protein